MKQCIKSNCIITPEGVISGYMEWEDGKITQLSEKPISQTCLDVGNRMVMPGIIDIHNHGFGGWSMTDPAEEKEVRGFAKAVASVGVTTVLPTAKQAAFEAIAKVVGTAIDGANVHGIHSEGPFWARGGENTVDEDYPLPDLEETKRLVEKAKHKMTMMAIAPELPHAYEVIHYLHQQKILVASAHTCAYSEDIHQAMDKVGLDIVTHLCNGMRGIHHRNVGALGQYLLEENLYYELITDLNHVCPEMIKICFKMQPYEKFLLISDSNYIAGLPSGHYMRYDKEMIADDQGLIKDLHGRICGSGKWVLYNMKQLVDIVKVPLVDVVKMASLNPARFLKLDEMTGSLTIGKNADFIIVDPDYVCQQTFVKGQCVYDRNLDKNVFNLEALNRKIA